MLFSLILMNETYRQCQNLLQLTSNDVTNVDSFSELIQLPVDEDVIPTQLSSSPVKPKRRATPIQAAHNELPVLCH